MNNFWKSSVRVAVNDGRQSCTPWRDKENILMLEAKALVKSEESIAESRHGVHIRQLMLCDNLFVVFAFNRSLAKPLDLIRRFKLFLLGRDIAATAGPCE